MCLALSEMSEDEADELTEAIESAPRDISYSAITRFLRSDEGGAYMLGPQAVERHKSGRCSGSDS